jgi:zinc/manganese transport system substrate-binding protein
MILRKATAVIVLTALVTPAAAGAATRPVVVTGVTQWASLARAVAGPDATVVSLLSDPNADPHDHEATTADAAHVARAAVVIENGAGYDTWLAQLVAARSHPPTVVNVARLVGVTAGENPHLFYSVRASKRLVVALASALRARGAAPAVSSRASALLARLDGVGRALGAIARSCHGVRVAATEDVAGYLLGDAGLRVVTPERLRLAVGNGVDPSVHDLALALIQLERHPAFLIDNIQTSTPLTNELVSQARRYHVAVIRVTETMTGTNYVNWINDVIARVATALRHQGCLA